jgi:hypothetical protein
MVGNIPNINNKLKASLKDSTLNKFSGCPLPQKRKSL